MGESVKSHLVVENLYGGAGQLSSVYTYEGSRTTPPCSEGVRWIVLSNVYELSMQQMQAFQKIQLYQQPYGEEKNWRPIQPLFDRKVIKVESNYRWWKTEWSKYEFKFNHGWSQERTVACRSAQKDIVSDELCSETKPEIYRECDCEQKLNALRKKIKKEANVDGITNHRNDYYYNIINPNIINNPNIISNHNNPNIINNRKIIVVNHNNDDNKNNSFNNKNEGSDNNEDEDGDEDGNEDGDEDNGNSEKENNNVNSNSTESHSNGDSADNVEKVQDYISQLIGGNRKNNFGKGMLLESKLKPDEQRKQHQKKVLQLLQHLKQKTKPSQGKVKEQERLSKHEEQSELSEKSPKQLHESSQLIKEIHQLREQLKIQLKSQKPQISQHPEQSSKESNQKGEKLEREIMQLQKQLQQLQQKQKQQSLLSSLPKLERQQNKQESASPSLPKLEQQQKQQILQLQKKLQE